MAATAEIGTNGHSTPMTAPAAVPVSYAPLTLSSFAPRRDHMSTAVTVTMIDVHATTTTGSHRQRRDLSCPFGKYARTKTISDTAGVHTNEVIQDAMVPPGNDPGCRTSVH